MSHSVTLTIPGEIRFVRFASQTAASVATLLIGENMTETEGAQFVHDFELAICEAFTNSVTHSRNRDALQMLTMTFEFKPRQLTVCLRDANGPFTLETPAPEITDYPAGGYGLMIIRKVMDGVTYQRDGDSNILSMSKTF